MIRIAVLGGIGSGKTYIAKLFNFPVFNADLEVAKIYKNNRQCFKKLKKKLPGYFSSFPAKKNQIIRAITNNEKNLKEITKIIHPEIKKKMHRFLVKMFPRSPERSPILDRQDCNFFQLCLYVVVHPLPPGAPGRQPAARAEDEGRRDEALPVLALVA